MPSPAYRTWRGRIESGTFTHAQCRAFARNVRRMADGWYDPPPLRYNARTTLTCDEAEELCVWLAGKPVELEAEHAAKGLAWLRRYAHGLETPTGVRGGFPTGRVLPDGDFDRFTYGGGGYHLGDERWGHTVPLWNVNFHNGDQIRYAAFAWQGRPSFAGEWSYFRQTAVAS